MNRELDLIPIRPLIPQAETTEASPIEEFQNATLRPIIKYQHDIIIEFFLQQKIALKKASQKNIQSEFFTEILLFIQKNASIKSSYIGICIGLMTINEHFIYSEHSNEFNKRIIGIIVQRLSDTLFPLRTQFL